jgi:hypothetical protein
MQPAAVPALLPTQPGLAARRLLQPRLLPLLLLPLSLPPACCWQQQLLPRLYWWQGLPLGRLLLHLLCSWRWQQWTDGARLRLTQTAQPRQLLLRQQHWLLQLHALMLQPPSAVHH